MIIFEYKVSPAWLALDDDKRTSYIRVTDEQKDKVTTFSFGKNTKKREWQEWKLIWESKIIKSPYKTADDWIEQMKKQKENDYMRVENKAE